MSEKGGEDVQPQEPSMVRTLVETPGVEVLGLGLALARHVQIHKVLANAPRGQGAPVLVVPGLLTGDSSTVLMRAFLRRLGYQTWGWNGGIHRGDVRNSTLRMLQRCEEMADRYGQAVRCVGWSLGGVVLREVARARPELVDRLITLGTPVIGGPKFTAFAPFYRRILGWDLDKMERQAAARNRAPIPVPITAIYSRWDRVVDWRACVDRFNDVHHVEVRATHSALAVNPACLRHVALALQR